MARQATLTHTILKGDPTGFCKRPAGLADPHAYGLTVRGNCLSPIVRDGDTVVISPNEKPRARMLVALHLVGKTEPLIKRLVSEFHPPPRLGEDVEFAIEFEMDNPPRGFMVPASKVSHCHPVTGLYRKGRYIPIAGASNEKR